MKKSNKKTFIRTTALIIAVLCTLMLFISCGGDQAENGKYGKLKVEIKDFRIDSRFFGDYLIVTYTFENNSNSNQTFDDCFDEVVYQNGVALSYGYDFINYWNDVKSGATVDVEVSYILSNATDDIEIEITVNGEDKIILSQTYSLIESE